MGRKKKEIILLVFLVILLIAINYPFLDNLVIKEFSNDRESVFVERVIDGDTIVLNDSRHVRLLGINTPEKGESYYIEAKDFLEKQVLNKTVFLEYGKDKTDLYNRTLAYVLYNSMNINQEIVRKGFANAYFLGKDAYYEAFQNTWKECIKENVNLCEKSEKICASCIAIKELNVDEDFLILQNICSFDCNLKNWSIKDEGRKKYIFGNFIFESNKEVKITAKDFKQTYVWTKTGDTLFLRDDAGQLVLWKKI